jgi:subtilisin family serine protease
VKDIRINVDDFSVFPDGSQMDLAQQMADVPNGLDRIDQIDLPLDKVYNYGESGKNVTVYILDTGLMTDHIDFQGRATCGWDLFRNVSDIWPFANDSGIELCGNNSGIEQFDNDTGVGLCANNSGTEIKYCVDSWNHGTSVAAVIGGNISGVAKDANLVSVKVISQRGGTASAVLAGLDFVRVQKKTFPLKPMVINMSLGSIYSKSVNRAVDSLVDSGVTVVTAAGNRGISACLVTPASSKRVISVGASTTSWVFKGRDRRAFFSNWGRCVDIFAYVTFYFVSMY